MLAEKLSAISAAIGQPGPSGDGLQNASLFQSESSEWNTEASLFQSENTEWKKDGQLFQSKNQERNKDARVFRSQNLERNKEASIFQSENPERNKETETSVSQNPEWNKEPSIAPPVEVPAIPDYHQIYAALRKGEMKGTPRKTTSRVANLLLHLADAPKGGMSHVWMAKTHKLSKGGIAKFMMMLHRRGLIVRTAYQTYGLTDKSRAILEEARHTGRPAA